MPTTKTKTSSDTTTATKSPQKDKSCQNSIGLENVAGPEIGHRTSELKESEETKTALESWLKDDEREPKPRSQPQANHGHDSNTVANTKDINEVMNGRNEKTEGEEDEVKHPKNNRQTEETIIQQFNRNKNNSHSSNFDKAGSSADRVHYTTKASNPEKHADGAIKTERKIEIGNKIDDENTAQLNKVQGHGSITTTHHNASTNSSQQASTHNFLSSSPSFAKSNPNGNFVHPTHFMLC